MQISLQDFEKIHPITSFKFNESTTYFYTPNVRTKWRVDTLLSKEPVTIEWLNKIRSNEILLDVGANVGMYSIWAAKFRNVNVIALEPEASNYFVLNKNIMINKLNKLIKSYCIGVSNKDEFCELYLPGNPTIGSSNFSLCKPLDYNLKPYPTDHSQGSMSFKIDSLINNKYIPVPDFIKIDVDGLEHKVIEGAKQTLKNKKIKSLIIELNTNLSEHLKLINFFENLGFNYSIDQVNKSIRKNGKYKGLSEYVFTR